jgi:O-antigen biosynthesis protein WbqP
MIKRVFDFGSAGSLLFCLCPLLLCIAIIIKLTSPGSVLYWSNRVGRHNKIFRMCKFRTMLMDTPPIATHLFKNADSYLTPIGLVLRKLSLDELPQFLNIALGDMTFVGPRPALFNQYDLINLRTQKRVHTLIPGITGWAQINGRDELPIPVKVDFDEYYLRHKSLIFDMKILFMTINKVLKKEGVQH